MVKSLTVPLKDSNKPNTESGDVMFKPEIVWPFPLNSPLNFAMGFHSNSETLVESSPNTRSLASVNEIVGTSARVSSCSASPASCSGVEISHW